MLSVCQEAIIDKYEQEWRPYGLLKSFFTAGSPRILQGEKLILPFKLKGNPIAIPVTCCSGPNFNERRTSEVMEINVVPYKEGFEINACDLEKVPFGKNQFEMANQLATENLFDLIVEGIRDNEDLLSRSWELQASQIWQTGSLSLTDKSGEVRYEYQFPTPASHFPAVATAWSDSANATPINDLAALASLIQSNGKARPDTVIMNEKTYLDFINTVQVELKGDLLRIDTIGINREGLEVLGGILKGSLSAGSHNLKIWVYNEEYDDPETGDPKKYVEDDNVIMICSAESNGNRVRYNRYFIPTPKIPMTSNISNTIGRLIPENISENGSVTQELHAYGQIDGSAMTVETRSRMIYIPVSFLTYGCLKTA